VEEGKTWLDNLNPNSMQVVHGFVEPSLAEVPVGARYQFERVGYFCADRDGAPGKPVFNRTVTLRDEWAKVAQKQAPRVS